ncbi:MAG: hypothetical protein WC292_00995 [Clostridia bacterium]
MNYETFETHEINDLERPTMTSSGASNTAQLLRAESGAQGAGASGSAGGAAAGGISGALGGIVAAIVTVTVMVAVITTTIFSPPTVSTADWRILHNYISFLFEGEESDNGYLITLYEGDIAVSSVTLLESQEMVIFENLQPESDYVITIENDYGMGLNKIKEFQIRTAGLPVAPEGKITVKSHQIDYDAATLSLEFELQDDYNYFSNFRINIASGDYDVDLSETALPASLLISLDGMSRGYITISIYADSASPSGGSNLLLTKYKIYY